MHCYVQLRLSRVVSDSAVSTSRNADTMPPKDDPETAGLKSELQSAIQKCKVKTWPAAWIWTLGHFGVSYGPLD